MPKFYCDYCDVFLTHDSPSVRKTHCQGWKHKASVKQWYQQFEVDIIQELIDLKVREYEARMGIRGPATAGVAPPPLMPGPPGARPW